MFENQIREIILKAGKILLDKKSELANLKPTYKESEGLVSEVDHLSEKFIKSEILKHFPDHFFLGEEDTYENQENMSLAEKAKDCWYVDPLDGTNNYLNNLDYYCVSIAHSSNGVLDFGMIYAPERQELYYAKAQGGAYFENLRTGEKKKLSIQDSSEKALNRSFVVTSLNSLGGKYKEKLGVFQILNEKCLSVRRFGSAALELCHTARGMFDVCWDYGLKPWDVNAGVVICQEAGLSVKRFDGAKVGAIDSSIVALRPHLESSILDLINSEFKL